MDTFLERGRCSFSAVREYDLGGGDVTALSFSGDGMEIMACGLSGKVTSFGSRDGGRINWKQQHSNPVMCCCHSLDGIHRVTGCEDGSLHVYDAVEGTRQHTLKKQGVVEAVNAVEFMIDGRYIVACYVNDVVIWDVYSGEILCLNENCHSGVVFDCATCPKDARRFATASEDGTAKVWILSVQRKTFLQMHSMRSNNTTGMSSIAWSPDGRFIATGSSPGAVRIWLAATGTPVSVIGNVDQNATKICWSPGSQYVVVIGGNTDGLIYEPLSKDKEESFKLIGHFDIVTACAWSRQGNLIATGDSSGNVKIWELLELNHPFSSSGDSSDNANSSDDEQGLSEAERELNAHYNLILAQEQRERRDAERAQRDQLKREENDQVIDINLDQKFTYNTTKKTIAEDDRDGSSESFPNSPTLSMNSQNLSPEFFEDSNIGFPTNVIDANLGNFNKYDSTNYIGELSKTRLVSSRDIDELERFQLSLSETAASLDETINQNEETTETSLETGLQYPLMMDFGNDNVFVPIIDKFTFKHHVTCVRLSSNGKLLVCIRDMVAYVWNNPLKTKFASFVLKGHKSSVLCGSWSPNSQRVLTGSADSSAVIWNISGPKGRMHCRLVGHTSDVLCCAWSPCEHDIVATGSMDSDVIIWQIYDKIKNYNNMRSLEGDCHLLHKLKFHSLYIRAIAFSYDGMALFSGSSDKTMKAWKVSTGQCLYTTIMRGKTNNETISIMSIAYSPKEQIVAVGCRDGLARIKDATSGITIKELIGHTSDVWSVTFSPCGEYVLTASWDRSMICFSVKSGMMLYRESAHTAGIKSIHWMNAFDGSNTVGEDDSIAHSTKFNDCDLAVSGGLDRSVYVWKTQNNLLRRRLDHTRSCNVDILRSEYISKFHRSIRESMVQISKLFHGLNIHIVNTFVCLQEYKDLIPNQKGEPQDTIQAESRQNDKDTLHVNIERESLNEDSDKRVTIENDEGDNQVVGELSDSGQDSNAILAIQGLRLPPEKENILVPGFNLISDSWKLIDILSYSLRERAASTDSKSDIEEYELTAKSYNLLEKLLHGCDDFHAKVSTFVQSVDSKSRSLQCPSSTNTHFQVLSASLLDLSEDRKQLAKVFDSLPSLLVL